MISVVIPAFNEEAVLESTTLALMPVLERLAPGSWEIVLVDDGSSDATGEIIRRLAREGGIRAASHRVNRGKGAAVRTGVLLTRGDAVLVCDADGSTPPDTLTAFLGLLGEGVDIVVGDRWSPGATVAPPQPPLRRVLGSGYTLLARVLTGVRLKDFNCGFKLFRGEVARHLLGSCRSDRWAWDVEVISWATRQGLALRAMPVRWSQGPRSKVRPVRDVVRSLGELASLWRRLRFPVVGQN